MTRLRFAEEHYIMENRYIPRTDDWQAVTFGVKKLVNKKRTKTLDDLLKNAFKRRRPIIDPCTLGCK